MRTIRRIQVAAAVAAGLLTVTAGTASAHHCYKEHWAEAAHENHLRGNTPWVPLSDLGVMYLIPPELQADCAWTADAAVADFMAAHGMPQEPLIHTKATVGSGAYYKKGQAPGPFGYLDDADFMELDVLLGGYLAECAGEG